MSVAPLLLFNIYSTCHTTGLRLAHWATMSCLSSCLHSLALSSRACSILDFFSDTPLWRRLDCSNILSVYDLLRLHFDCDYGTILDLTQDTSLKTPHTKTQTRHLTQEPHPRNLTPKTTYPRHLIHAPKTSHPRHLTQDTSCTQDTSRLVRVGVIVIVIVRITAMVLITSYVFTIARLYTF